MAEEIPDATISTLARSIFKEASSYGFQQIDMVRLINQLMDLCTGSEGTAWIARDSGKQVIPGDSGHYTSLPLVGERVRIRAYNGEEDARLLEQWLPDRYGRHFLLSCATAQSITTDILAHGPGNHLGMVTLLDGRPIGAMAFLDHSERQKRAELRKLIGDPEARGHGYAEEATLLWVRYGIHGLGLEKIYLSTLQTQIANIKLNEKIGFQVEGLLKDEVLIDGRRHDVLRMGLSTADD